ncbi:MAG: adenylate/guanylate cyclase domain-containing protein [Gammaproteobacteria bacterium]|nr:adenylate/guanylate cyclase domain-containing protein [Gammaproteobacteria bacterium]NIR85670.1 adenylate/guanylate cyclase domain-containing protein [Gammaproteobacteria bacterium]NIR90158.1 adenylate/guanylate cyclase domain-containing protein [Gammaproteobacteria bacterium]NIU06804.1 adenylate/guanylate cyclase domain-containing protein [Gammaproteobacteria bacterium]NIV53737.1 adenylate/guanylate cyclase domain-containing protein [Gammaproteobacteria bacterium]
MDSEAKLPARIRERIHAQQESSEILIGWAQLGVVVIFGTLYAIAPKPYTEAPRFTPVPWVLSAYLVFTLFRLALAHARRLPQWLLYVSVVADMALLLGLIWSFHLQYEQPASFYLKAPTLLYVFIFIALRALRFEARFVVLAGLVAAAGWLLLVLYVVTVDPADPMITRNYVEYMTSNSVLLGAEFDKIMSILIVTAILAFALTRARRLLIRSVVDSSVARDLSRFVPRQVAAHIGRSEEQVAAGQGEVREATILYTDLEGFTSVSERLSPPELIATLNEYFAAVSGPIEEHGGVINQFQGDAILATFNVPETLPDHAASAVRAALEIQRVLRTRTFGQGITLHARIGINSGTVVGGLVGTSERLGYTVHGDDVNLAARLEQLNKEYGTYLLLSERTCQLAGFERFRFQRLGTVTVRGRSTPANVFTVAGDDAGPAAISQGANPASA